MKILRNILEIDENKCNGCGLCANACHEHAIEIIDHKACLVKEIYCDGLGDCLPHCKQDAIKIVQKYVEAYSEEAVMDNIKSQGIEIKKEKTLLNNWPVKLRLVPTVAPFFNHAHLLVCADCTAYAHNNLMNEFMKNRVCLIACPKLEMIDYERKIRDIIKYNDIKSITLLIMEVPCCSDLLRMIQNAILNSGKDIHYSVRIVKINGEVSNDVR